MLQQIVHICRALLEPFHEPVEYLKGRFRVTVTAARVGQAVEVRAVALELGEVGLREMDTLRVERFKVEIEKLAGHRLVEPLLRIVVEMQQLGRKVGDLAINRAWANEVESVGRGCGTSGYRGLFGGGGADFRLGRAQREGHVKGQQEQQRLGDKSFNHDILDV